MYDLFAYFFLDAAVLSHALNMYKGTLMSYSPLIVMTKTGKVILFSFLVSDKRRL